MKKLKALVIGATGATGRELVNLLINDEDFDKVSIFVRKAPDLEREKLKIHIINFNEIIVMNEKNGKPFIKIIGKTLKIIKNKIAEKNDANNLK